MSFELNEYKLLMEMPAGKLVKRGIHQASLLDQFLRNSLTAPVDNQSAVYALIAKERARAHLTTQVLNDRFGVNLNQIVELERKASRN